MSRRVKHRVHAYADAVLDGTIVAGPLVRLACARHMRDLETAAAKGFVFHGEAATYAIDFIEHDIRLPDTTDEYGDPKPFHLEPWQVFIIGSMFGWKWARTGYRRYRNAYIEVGKGNGKALALDTPIPTVTGWTTMGDVQVGDLVFDERGRPTRVIGAFDVLRDHPCYRVTFDDGSSIVADAEHLWMTEQRRAGGDRGGALRGVQKHAWGRWRHGLRTTQQIAETIRYKNGRYQSANHSIPVAGPLGTPEADLPIAPYLLGVWIGDGDSDDARVTIDDREHELLDHLLAVGAEIGQRQQSTSSPRTPRYRVVGLHTALRHAGLLHHKHIPAAYLRASVDQRLALLHGLMDTDGSINKANGQCEFTTTTQAIAEGFRELATSLGLKLSVQEGYARLGGRIISPLWRMTFYPPPDLPIFRLRRKLRYQIARHARRRLTADRRIVSCEPVPSVPVRCIAVEAPSQLFLAGRAMVATHNTPMLAAVGLYGLLMDGQKAPEIYATANDRDQAMILFRDAVRMVDASPTLKPRIRQAGIEHVSNLAYGLGFFRAFSREQGSKSGTRPHMGLIDEVHEAPNADIINKVRAGAKGNQDAMFWEITNSGYDRTSICWQHHEHVRKILEQSLDDERWFAYVCSLDDGDDPLVDEACHLKVNPNLGVSIFREYLRDQVSAAKHIPSETNTVLRLNFCMWTQAVTRFIDLPKWLACEHRIEPHELVGARCYGGLDLGQSDDFTAFVLIWVLEDGRIAVRPHFWLPDKALEKPNRPYEQWTRTPNALTIMRDCEVIDLGQIETAVRTLCQQHAVREVAYDRRFAEQMAQNLTGDGITMVETGQGWQLTEALRKLAHIIRDETLVHDGNPILTWMATNLVVLTREGLMRPVKDKAADKIDGQVALAMALDRIVKGTTSEPLYQTFAFGGRR